ncbi:hypothetical protein V9T40_012717 [Parthenolecanium corni]|uniref:Uncharacterized protein n=1 Tax=Parthenolecanium corni TaxID=536013 RepID=A0AAN9T9F1_9HEMI
MNNDNSNSDNDNSNSDNENSDNENSDNQDETIHGQQNQHKHRQELKQLLRYANNDTRKHETVERKRKAAHTPADARTRTKNSTLNSNNSGTVNDNNFFSTPKNPPSKSTVKAPQKLELCKLKRHIKIHLCKIILASEKYKIINFNEEAIGQCKKREIDLPVEEIFKRSMLSCYPVSWDDKTYNLSSTGEIHELSLYLYIWPKSYDGSPRPRPRLVAKIMFTSSEIDELQRLQDDGSSSYTGGLSTKQDEGGSSSSAAWPTINYEPDE